MQNHTCFFELNISLGINKFHPAGIENPFRRMGAWVTAGTAQSIAVWPRLHPELVNSGRYQGSIWAFWFHVTRAIPETATVET